MVKSRRIFKRMVPVGAILCVTLVLTGIHSSPTLAAGVPPTTVKDKPSVAGETCGWQNRGTRIGFTIPDGSGELQATPTTTAFAAMTVDQDRSHHTFQILAASFNSSEAYVSEVTGEIGGTYPHWEALPFELAGFATSTPALDVSLSGNFTTLSVCLISTGGPFFVSSVIDAGGGGTVGYRVSCQAPDGTFFAARDYTAEQGVGLGRGALFLLPPTVFCQVRMTEVPDGYVPAADEYVGFLNGGAVRRSVDMKNRLGTFDLEVKTTKLHAAIFGGQVNYVFQVEVTNLGTVDFTPSPDVNGDAYVPVLISSPTGLLNPVWDSGTLVQLPSKLVRWAIPSIAAGQTRTMFSPGFGFPAPVDSYVPGVHDVCASIPIEDFARTPHETNLSNNTSCVSVNP
jgi:hypothetical protein